MDKRNIDEWEDLVIRTCKRRSCMVGLNPVDRLRGILARRCGEKRGQMTLDFIVAFLADIVDRFLPDKQTNDLSSLLLDIRPTQQFAWRVSNETKLAPFKIESGFFWNMTKEEVEKAVESTKTYLISTITVLMSRIALTEVKYFPGYSNSAYFRNADKRAEAEKAKKALVPTE